MRHFLSSGIAVLLANIPASARDESLTVSEMLAKVRQAVGFDALSKVRGDWLWEGAAEYEGIPGRFEMRISPSSHFHQVVDAHGRHEVGFDGKTVWQRNFSRRPHELDFGEAESVTVFRAIQTYRW